MKNLSKLSILPFVLLSACAEYEASNFVGFDNGAQVYRVPVFYDENKSSRVHQNGFNYQIGPYCPNGYREISRTQPVLKSESGAGIYPGGYVAPIRQMETVMTFACLGEPAVREVQ